MSKININELINIAKSINKNIIKNKDREEKIPTDKFIMDKFNISRKNYSKLIKNTSIKYNRSTHMYDVPEKINDDKLSSFIGDEVNEKKVNSVVSNDDNLSVITEQKIKKVIKKEYPEILEIINLYKKNKINFNQEKSKKINIHRQELHGELFSKSFKTYKKVLDDFVEFCSNRIEKQRDLVAIALLEFMEKYS